MRTGAARLAEDLAKQIEVLRESEPGYTRLLELVRDELPDLGADLNRAWRDRTFFAWYDRPLLLLASLRNDALAEGAAHPLWAVVVDAGPGAPVPTVSRLREAVDPSRMRFWDTVSRRTVQTNETSRAVAWLWPAGLLGSVDPETTLHLVDVGTSAGLNLVADDPAMGTSWTADGEGALRIGDLPPLGTRLGLDRNPLDVRDPQNARWLQACVWPSDRERGRRLEIGIAAFLRAADRGAPPVLEPCPIEEVPDRVAGVGGGARLFVLQTVVRDYLSPEQQAAYERGLLDLIADRPPGRVLWIELEVDHGTGPGPPVAVLRVHAAERGGRIRTLMLARTHPHPRTLFVEPGQPQALVELFRG
jgi:hypothetical protein